MRCIIKTWANLLWEPMAVVSRVVGDDRDICVQFKQDQIEISAIDSAHVAIGAVVIDITDGRYEIDEYNPTGDEPVVFTSDAIAFLRSFKEDTISITETHDRILIRTDEMQYLIPKGKTPLPNYPRLSRTQEREVDFDRLLSMVRLSSRDAKEIVFQLWDDGFSITSDHDGFMSEYSRKGSKGYEARAKFDINVMHRVLTAMTNTVGHDFYVALSSGYPIEFLNTYKGMKYGVMIAPILRDEDMPGVKKDGGA